MVQAKLAIVIPVFNEQQILPELKRRLVEILVQIPSVDGQVIFVDDGSIDEAPGMMLEMCQQDSRFVVVELSRNFGSGEFGCGAHPSSRCDTALRFRQELLAIFRRNIKSKMKIKIRKMITRENQ